MTFVRGARRVVTPKRRKSWNVLLAIAQNIVGNATVLGSALQFTESGNTVLRMMGEYIITPNGTIAAEDQATVTVAIGVVSSDAFDLGATAIPDPAGEPEYGWLYWQSHRFEFVAATPASDQGNAGGAIRHSFDVRSQRKMGAGQSLCWVLQYVNTTGNPNLRISLGQCRVLLALP